MTPVRSCLAPQPSQRSVGQAPRGQGPGPGPGAPHCAATCGGEARPTEHCLNAPLHSSRARQWRARDPASHHFKAHARGNRRELLATKGLFQRGPRVDTRTLPAVSLAPPWLMRYRNDVLRLVAGAAGAAVDDKTHGCCFVRIGHEQHILHQLCSVVTCPLPACRTAFSSDI